MINKPKAPLENWAKWMKENLFSTPVNSFVSILILCLVVKILGPLFDWFFYNSVWSGSAADCKISDGACLVFLKVKARFILFGMFPEGELWRLFLSLFLFIAGLYYSRKPNRWHFSIIYKVWLPLFLILYWLIRGGWFLTSVPMEQVGGLPITLILSFIGVCCSYPLGILLALGRRSQLPLVKVICVIYIELIRGIPMISLLFMASVMFPLFLPDGLMVPKIMRAQLAIILFASAYMAEVVRGGLAAIPKGQIEAANALGLNYWQSMGLVILPQALKIVIPPTVNTVIGMFKDTSLVVIIAIFDLLMTTKTAVRDPEWLGFSVESYLFAAFIYFIFCFSMGKYSRGLERTLKRGHA